MPPVPDGTFMISVTFSSPRQAHLVLCGDVDLAARQQLADAVDQLTAAAPDNTIVDLADVTFAGATLVNFLAQVRAAIPATSALVACRPTPMTDFVFRKTDTAGIASINRHLCV